MLTQLAAVLRRPFVLDVRAMALLRMAVAVILLTDLAIRSTDLEAHYTNLGVLPLHVLFERAWNPYQFSLHTSSGIWEIQALLFLLAAALAVGLLLGWRTRWMTVGSWLMLVSLQNRNPMIAQGGDDLLRMLLFWGIFLPWGRVWSADAQGQPALRQYSHFSVATVAFVVQIALVYVCTAFLKNAPEWTTEGTAIYYALSLDQVLMPVGRLLYPHYELMRWLTHLTYYTELLLPVLLFIPVATNFFRLVFVVVMFGFHIGISLTLFVGLFFLISFAALVGLLPTPAMNWLGTKFGPGVRRVAAYLREWGQRLPGWLVPLQVQMQVQWHPRIPAHPQFRLLPVLRNTVLLVLLAYTVWWNLDGIVTPRYTMHQPLRWFGYLFRTDQHWGMFAPAVFKDDGWYILEGRTNDGRLVDLYRGGRPVTYAKPASVMALHKNDRWRKYSENYLFIDNEWMRPYYCNYMRRIWEKDPSHKPLRHLDVVYMKEVSLPNYQVEGPTRQVLCGCEP
ncbi:HTTM domain-containing protein [Hymenobacter koreensis]|uniref:HTTM domain-containing protein n=1 Tax=Hymenobacter koreensis TaxID=1084523 RepID=A0ABP8IVA8_9BACT